MILGGRFRRDQAARFVHERSSRIGSLPPQADSGTRKSASGFPCAAGSGCLFRPAAEVFDQAAPALRLTRLADVAPVQDQPMMRVQLVGVGDDLLRARPRRPRGVLPGASGMRFETRKICVSTAIVGWPKAMLSTTLAVLRPTPGSVSSSSRFRGTSPPKCSTKAPREADDVLGLGAIEADRLDQSRTLSSPSASIFSGVSAMAKSAGVALLTPASVACAESTTATSRVKGFL